MNLTGPAWLAGSFAAIMIVTAGYCAARLVIARARQQPTERDVDLVHTAMGVAMAGMLVTRLNLLPDGVWAGLFVLATGWFAMQAGQAWLGLAELAVAQPGAGHPGSRPGGGARLGVRHGMHHVPHLVMCVAMVYMLMVAVLVPAGTAGGGMAMGGPAAAARFPVIALVLAVFMAGYVMWQADRLPALAGGPLSPRLAACCQIAMGVTMGYMLVVML